MASARLDRADGSATVACERCLLADNPILRLRGLLGRTELLADEGLLLRPSSSIHMFFMRFAIDAVFLARDDTVMAVVPDLRPWRAAWRRGAHSVLELRAGQVSRLGIAPGDRILLDQT